MAKKNVARFMLERLHGWGVKRIYDYPGDGINALTGAFHEVGDRIEFIQISHEELAWPSRTAHARLTDEVDVCMAISGARPLRRGDRRDAVLGPEGKVRLVDAPFVEGAFAAGLVASSGADAQECAEAAMEARTESKLYIEE
jgi:thiamine pyrophosphate-dependent enzyme